MLCLPFIYLKMFSLTYFLFLTQACILLLSFKSTCGLTKFDKKDLENLREEVRQMFQHAYDSYLSYAYPYDELRPLSCDGVDTWGSYSLTLIDALDTLAVMGNYTEFQRVVNIVTANANFEANINVSVFETNIRIIGGLLSAHLLSHRAGVNVVPGWPCNGPLLELAEDVARRLIAAFDTPTGMPYGTVNLLHGVPVGETTVTCTAGVGTFILELGTLSRLTGDPLFEEVALTALDALHAHRSPLGLVGNHIDVATGRWTAQDAGIGAGVDSYYEYLAKGAILLQRPELMHMFNEGRDAIEKYLKRDDWHLWVSMSKGQVTLPVFQSLEAYWPGVLSLTGEISKGMKSLHNYHQVWKQYGFTPEFYYIPQGEVGTNRESYPLRPELIESVMYLYRATGDPYLIEVGRDILRSIQHSAKTSCGYATIKDVRDHRKEDRMESFFLAETTKYLYLLFDPDNFLHNRGQTGTVVQTPWGECVVDAGGYIFNTEAHPIDPGALHCCSGSRQIDVQDILGGSENANDIKGEPLSTYRELKVDPTMTEYKQEQDSKGSLPVQPVSKTWKNSLKTQRDKLLNSNLNAQLHNKFPPPEAVPDSDQLLRSEVNMYSIPLEGENDMFEIGNDVEQDTEMDEPSSEEEEDDCDYMDLLSDSFEDVPEEILKKWAMEETHYVPDSYQHTNLQEQLQGEDIEEEIIPNEKEPVGPVVNDKVTAESVEPEDMDYVSSEWDSTDHDSFESLDRSQIPDLDTLTSLDNETPEERSKRISVLAKLHMEELQKVLDRITNGASIGKDFSLELENPLDLQLPYEDSKDGAHTGDGSHQDDDGTLLKTSSLSLTDDSADSQNTESENLDGRTGNEACKSEDENCEKLSKESSSSAEYLWMFTSPKKKFDPQVLFERLQTEHRYTRNKSWILDHGMLSCKAQHFLQRLSLSGEMFDVP